MRSAPITDEQLSEYLDNRLEPPRRAQVEVAIESDPELARTVAAYRRHEDGLRAAAAADLEEPVPPRLLETVRQSSRSRSADRTFWRPSMRHVAQLAASLLIGVAAGWLLRGTPAIDGDDLLAPFVDQALLSHELFESDHELETLRIEGAALDFESIQSPFRTPVRVPQLLGTAYQPVLLRTSQGSRGPGVELAYADAEGGLASLLIRQHSDSDDLPVQFREVAGRSVLYWLDGPLVYALVAEGGEQDLRAMARSVYAAMAIGGARTPLETSQPGEGVLPATSGQ